MRTVPLLAALAVLVAVDAGSTELRQVPKFGWEAEWPHTDFTKVLEGVSFEEILSGGPPKDGIPAIDEPDFLTLGAYGDFDNIADLELADQEPVITLVQDGLARAYPLRYLMWHEIVNDEEIGVAVTYCPLCNSGIAFSAKIDETPLTFGVTGKLRNSDLIMYDRQTESWWQQFTGEAIVGEHVGKTLTRIPVALESWGAFRLRAENLSQPNTLQVLAKPGYKRPYGRNPYQGYDSLSQPWLYQGDYGRLEEMDLNPLDRVIVAGTQAWSLQDVWGTGEIDGDNDLVALWTEKCHASALDTALIEDGERVPSVMVVKRTENQEDQPVPHEVVFAFVADAFWGDSFVLNRPQPAPEPPAPEPPTNTVDPGNGGSFVSYRPQPAPEPPANTVYPEKGGSNQSVAVWDPNQIRDAWQIVDEVSTLTVNNENFPWSEVQVEDNTDDKFFIDSGGRLRVLTPNSGSSVGRPNDGQDMLDSFRNSPRLGFHALNFGQDLASSPTCPD